MASAEKNDPHQQLRDGFERLLKKPIKDWHSIAQTFHSQQFASQEHWVKAGDYCQQICYILAGLLRVYYIDADGNEVNQHFYQGGEVLSPISSIINDEPCQYYIQALEPSKVMLANTTELYDRQADNPEWLSLELTILQNVFVKMARREAQLLLGNGEQRYKWFCKHYPELSQKLPQYHIASFLGITAVSLSRIRKKMKAE